MLSRADSDVVALAAALAQPWASVVLSGATTVAQLTSNLRGLDVRLDPADLPRLAEPPEEYWRTRAALPWTCSPPGQHSSLCAPPAAGWIAA